MIHNPYILATVGSVDFSLFLLELPVLAFHLFLCKNMRLRPLKKGDFTSNSTSKMYLLIYLLKLCVFLCVCVCSCSGGVCAPWTET